MKIKVGFFSVLLFLSLFLTHSYFAICALISVILHELGHILAAKICGVNMSFLKISIYGAGLTPSNYRFSYTDEIIIALFGPLTNIVTALLMLPFYSMTSSDLIVYFVSSSLILAFLNLLPVKTFDGGRIVHSLLCIFFYPETSDKILSVISFFFIFVLWSGSIYLMLVFGMGLSSFVFSLSLFSRFFIAAESRDF